MKKLIIILLSLISCSAFANFDSVFYNRTLRIDYIHTGSNNTEVYSIDEVKTEPFWGGTHTQLIEGFMYGKYYFKVFDFQSGSLIYSRGYGSLFGEWQTTEEAKEIPRSFTESIIMPLPKDSAEIVFFSRNKKGVLEEKFNYIFNPNDYFISPERRLQFPSFDVFISGPPNEKVDIVILPEGYTKDEMGEFIADCQKFKEILFSFSPYKEHIDKFNIRGVLAPSPQSGTDIPADTIWKKTLLNTSFYTFDSERYCMTRDFKSVRDMAANAPYDQIYILVNSDKYGGGAIYNYYSLSVSGNLKAAKIFVHEFGHGFAGLADEYYTSDVSYSEFYPVDVEPWEPNITTLVDFDKKWKNLLDENTPIPTPDTGQYRQMLGVFEGGGYVAKGVYRPKHDCLMKSFDGDSYCEACYQAIEKMILFYTE
ncbi:MAG: peptidase M64 [Bacteroidetes bacterium]|nr:MAG: peptidase M64 [Bacteroidota bacterium]